jgi:dipeptidyl aminopeptidase/acylaminoacyl peptidase
MLHAGDPFDAWVGHDEHGGEPAAELPDRRPPPHWSLEAIAMTGRPHHLEVSPDGTHLVFVLETEVADLWTVALPGRAAERLTAGRSPVGRHADSAPPWSPDGRAIAFVDRARVVARRMGHPSAYRDAYRAGSALHRLEALAAPVPVAHGELDTRVPFESSRRLVARLREVGATYEYVTYRNEGHTLTRPASRLHLARRLVRFLDWHLM